MGSYQLTKERETLCNGVQGGTPIMMGLKGRVFAPLVAVSLEGIVNLIFRIEIR